MKTFSFLIYYTGSPGKGKNSIARSFAETYTVEAETLVEAAKQAIRDNQHMETHGGGMYWFKGSIDEHSIHFEQLKKLKEEVKAE